MITYIITFYSHFYAIEFSRAMKLNDIHVILMPIPRALSSSCGTCAKIQHDAPFHYESSDAIEGVYIETSAGYELLSQS